VESWEVSTLSLRSLYLKLYRQFYFEISNTQCSANFMSIFRIFDFPRNTKYSKIRQEIDDSFKIKRNEGVETAKISNDTKIILYITFLLDYL
jgi:hypothetical protein